jgi:hypothetical protein
MVIVPMAIVRKATVPTVTARKVTVPTAIARRKATAPTVTGRRARALSGRAVASAVEAVVVAAEAAPPR